MDLVEALDAFTTMKLHRPVRKCTMRAESRIPLGQSNPLDLTTGDRVPCDCSSLECNPKQEDFPHRQLSKKSANRTAGREPSKLARTSVVDAEKGIS